MNPLSKHALKYMKKKSRFFKFAPADLAAKSAKINVPRIFLNLQYTSAIWDMLLFDEFCKIKYKKNKTKGENIFS